MECIIISDSNYQWKYIFNIKRMNEDAQSSIIQILNSFDMFIHILEDQNWCRFVQPEDIKVAFKLGNYVEKVVNEMESKIALSDFITTLDEWWKTRNRTKVHTEDYYRYASDKLIIKFFTSENVSENALDVAVRVYTAIHPKARMQNVISELILSSSHLAVVSEILEVFVFQKELKSVEYNMKLKSWANLLELGEENTITSEVNNMLAPYKVETALYVLLGMLSLTDVSPSEKLVQNVILFKVLEKMLNRNALSKPFWLTLMKEVDSNITLKLCENYDQFLESLFNFIVYLGCMMIKDKGVWRSDPNISICPEISYYDLLHWVKSISIVNTKIKIFTRDKLTEAKVHTACDIWEQMIKQLCLE